ncbi:hypothetical protein PAF15_00135 [Weissella koreensis]|uniref:hypothetical protein n=1 Tax=Weissella koreensis TaxID=165096 RepID=UPI0022BA6924|nr:hypothetical protein [Weissella koreensis]MCZ9310385.1 hypothetical protein [Weissella koreensis]
MQKKHQQNWIKLGNVADIETNSINFVEQWIAHNTDLQILKRYEIEKSDLLPPNHTAKTALTYVVRWRKALQKYKGRWQWREVSSYVFVEVGAITAPKPAKPKLSENNLAKSTKIVSPKVQEEVPKKESKKVDVKIVDESKHDSKRLTKPKQSVNKNKIRHNETKVQAKSNKAQQSQTENGHNQKHNKKSNDKKEIHEIKARFIAADPIILHGLDQKQAKVYFRRPLIRNK